MGSGLFLLKVLRTAAVLAVTARLVGGRRYAAWILAALGIALAGVGAMVWDHAYGTRQVTLAALSAVTLLVHETGLAASLVLATFGLKGRDTRLPERGARALTIGLTVELVLVGLVASVPAAPRGAADAGVLLPGELATDLAFFVFLGLLLVMARRAEARQRLAGAVAAAREEMRAAAAESARMLAADATPPLAAMRALLAQIARAAADPHGPLWEVERYVAEAQAHVAATETAITDALEINAQKSLELRVAPVQRLVADALEHVFGQTPRSWMVFEYDLDPGLQVAVDPRKIDRVLSHLINYAIHLLGGEGVLRFGATPLSEAVGRVELSLTLPGLELPSEQRRRLFHRPATPGHGDGAHFGLAVSRRLVEAHGGIIECVAAPGGGTAFKFTVAASPVRANDYGMALPRTSADLISVADANGVVKRRERMFS